MSEPKTFAVRDIDEEWLTRLCPYCDAGAGAWCRSLTSGRPSSNLHMLRSAENAEVIELDCPRCHARAGELCHDNEHALAYVHAHRRPMAPEPDEEDPAMVAAEDAGTDDRPLNPASLSRAGWWIQVTAERGRGELCGAHCPWLLATDCDLEAGHQGEHAYLLTWRGDRGLDPRAGAGA